jgi:uncharacterized damage-inducible protein DinB
MNAEILITELNSTQQFFDRSTAVLQEKDSSLKPTGEMLTAAQQVAHVAHTIDWFMEGAFRPEGFSMDFEAMENKIKIVTSLEAARVWLSNSFEAARVALAKMSPADLMVPIAAGEIMGGAPCMAAISGIGDHTAHHRGALTVYSRLAGYTPAMPYM